MATQEQRDEFREYIGDSDEPYALTDEQVDTMLARVGDDPRDAAHAYWQNRAASYAEMVDISEAGSSRKNSQLYKNAMEQAERFAPVEEQSDPSNSVRIGDITR